MTREEAVDRMIEVLAAEEPRQFSIGLVGYWIEVQPYSADMLTVDHGSAMDLTRTAEGFSCFAFFPPERLASDVVDACGVQTAPDGTPFVIVRLEVKRRDIWLVAEIIRSV